MIHATVSGHINAPAELVFTLYWVPDNWPRIFPTIRAVRMVRESGDEKVVEVDHAFEGKVINVVRRTSSTQIDLEGERRNESCSPVSTPLAHLRSPVLRQTRGRGGDLVTG